MASKTVAVQIAIRNAEAAIRVLKSLGAEGEAALDKITTTAPRAAAALNNVEREIGKAGKSGAVFQQLGYQVNDFFVQVQGGQGILTERVPLSLGGKRCGFYQDRSGMLVAFHATPGYETYKGLGWYGVILAAGS